ncbi:odorant receptor 4-like [Nylanderia fulva]|uniref:odorant receptor 4-like n=1 Tax=Nylanderia fulva TaxID=613905 RepID=UPI0010FB6721|nr:odorant receptor 4-like [Nylanderia fulva]
MRDRSQLPESMVEPMVGHNVNYEHDINYTMQLCRWVLKPIGIWHLINGNASRNAKLISLALIVTCLSALCFVLIPSGLHTLFYEKDINIKVKLFGPVGFCLTSTIKYCYLGARGPAFGRCIRIVENDWRTVQNPAQREMMLKKALVGRRLTILCALFLYTGGLSYHTIMPLSSRQVSENFTFRPLTYPGYNLFFDPQVSPVYEIVFCIHCLFALITYNITTAACSLAAIFVTHACGQIQILIMLLGNLVDGKMSKDNTVEKRLSVIAKHHVQILKFSANVEEVLREICLMELVTSTLTICLLEYYCLTEWENSDAAAILTYFILLVSFTFNTLIFCYIGELLVEQYSKIGSAAYNINWYDLRGNKGLSLVLIITMSHYPPKLTAGKIFDLSVYTFGAVLKTSLVYLNMLRTVTT